MVKDSFMSDDLLTSRQAAAELGVTDSRVRQLIIDGKLPAQRFGRSHMIRRSDLKDVVIGNVGRPSKNSTEKKERKITQRKKKTD
jgi:excisionase family DNA binding protein